MTPLFKKLNFKDHPAIVVVNAPGSFAAELAAMEKLVPVATTLKAAKAITFALVFATRQQEIDQAVKTLHPKLQGDAVLWFCYPKGSSKNYTCDFNRDTGWAALGKLGWEPVRMVAIDADWSALRFRDVDYIKTITRRESHALTDAAKKRTSQKGK